MELIPACLARQRTSRFASEPMMVLVARKRLLLLPTVDNTLFTGSSLRIHVMGIVVKIEKIELIIELAHITI